MESTTATSSRTRRAGTCMMAVGVIAVMFVLVAPAARAVDHPEHCGDDTASTTRATGIVDLGNDNAPAGNNGTVKIDGCELDQGTGPSNDKPGNGDPDNEPHIGCLVTVDWYNYEEGELFSSVAFEVWPPTGTAAITVPVTGHRAPGDAHAAFAGSSPFTSANDVYIGEDPASGAGAEGLDASVTYRMDEALAAFTPHPQHGWHVKLTINADGSRGADVKHKVFWTGPCVRDTTTTTTGGGTTTTTITGGTTTTTITGGTTTTTAAPAVAGTDFENTTTAGPAPSVLGVQLARTGNDVRVLLLVAGLFLLLGGAALRRGSPDRG